MASIGYRYRFGKLPPSLGEGVYVMGRMDSGNTWEDGEEVNTSHALMGSTVGFGADTIFGPIYIGHGTTEGGNSRFYFSLGSLF